MRQALYISTGVFLVLPVLVLVLVSLVTNWGYPSLFGEGITLSNWVTTVGGGGELARSFLTSASMSLGIAAASTATGFWVGRSIMYHPWRRTLISFAYYPYLIAPVVLGVLWRFFFLQGNLTGTIGGVMLAQFLFVFPYAILFFSGFWTQKVRDLEHQASTLGASPGQIIRQVLLPTARPFLVVCFFQCFLISWFEYGITQVIGIGKVPTLTVRTMQFVNEANPYYAGVAACLMVLPLILLLLVNRRIFARNEMGRD